LTLEIIPSAPEPARSGPAEIMRDERGGTFRPSLRDAYRASRFLLVPLFGFFLLILVAFRASGALLGDPDTFWHLAVGRHIWQAGAVPQFDEFSYTFEGQPWMAVEWLAQLNLFGAYSVGGWRGVVLLTAVTVALSYALLFLVLSRKMRLTIAIGIAATAYIFSMPHFLARPQIFADPLIVLWAAGLVRAVESKTTPSALLWPIITLWANLHGSFTFALAIGAALGAEAFFASRAGERLRTTRRWTGFLAVAILCACFTPYGYRPMLYTLQIFGENDTLPYIQEWQPITLKGVGINEVVTYGLLFLSLYKGAKIPFWRLIMTIGLLSLAFRHIRFLSLFAFVTPILLATPLTQQFPFLRLATQLEQDPQFFRVINECSKKLSYPLSGLIACGIIAFAAFGPVASPKADITPAAAVDYIFAQHLGGRIYNPYDFGGYLIFRGIKTFVDGRTAHLFLNGFIPHLHDVTVVHPDKFLPYLAELHVSIALVQPDSPEARELANSTEWKKIYADKIAELYKKVTSLPRSI